MNENEIMKDENKNEEFITVSYESEPCEDSGSGINGKLVVGGLIAVIGGGLALYKCKIQPKREQKLVEKLRKKGYAVERIDDEKPVVEVDEEDVSEVEESE